MFVTACPHFVSDTYIAQGYTNYNYTNALLLLRKPSLLFSVSRQKDNCVPCGDYIYCAFCAILAILYVNILILLPYGHSFMCSSLLTLQVLQTHNM